VTSTSPSHKGYLIQALVGDQPVIFLQGRFHYYEGYRMSEVVYPVQTLACLGVQTLIVTNASGSLREQLTPGTIVQLTDHINFMGTNPLIGQNDGELGERFPSLNQTYDPIYLELCASIARQAGIRLEQGVYIGVHGPSLETKAECAAFALWGADLVGMSTVPEVITARHSGMKVAAFSIVTNYSNLFHDLAHSQEEIQSQASQAGADLKRLISGFVSSLQAQA
jgi:purine-nucleoside phosphorylase